MHRTISCLVFLLSISLGFAAEVVEITDQNWQSICPMGKEADWIYGDYVLRNDKLVAVVAKPIQTRNANMTVRNVGGSIIDLTFRHRSNDQLSCFYPGAATQPIRYLNWNAEGDTASVTVSSDFRAEQPDMEVTYELKDGNKFIKVTTVYSNRHDREVRFSVTDSIRADRGFDHDLKPELYVCHDYWWKQAYGIYPTGHELQAVSDTLDKGRPIFSYRGESGSKVTLQPGETYKFERLLIPGEHGMAVVATAKQQAGETLLDLAVVVTDANGFVPAASVTVSQDGKEIGRALTPDAGPLLLKLPTGEYSVEVAGQGRGADYRR